MRGNKTKGFDPVDHNREEMLAEAMKAPDFAKIWNDPDPEIKALDIILNARKRAGITQQEIARRMHTSQAAVARIEKLASSDTKHLPSLASLKKYAAALGLKLKIDFDPVK
jgi:ribosome-binding protein aMBF1 (putative translation factor)